MLDIAREGIKFLGGVDVGDLSGQRMERLKLHTPIFKQVAREKSISPALLGAFAWTESDFNADAVNSTTGAKGLMQIIPSNFAAYGLTQNPVDPLGNVRAGASDLLAKGLGSKSLLAVVAGYNGFKSYTDPIKLDLFTTYYRKIAARWAYLSLHGYL